MNKERASKQKTTHSAKKPAPAIDAPFAKSILKKAEAIASAYRLMIDPEPDVGFLGRTVEMPYVMGDGETIETCVQQVREATVAAIATMLEAGERPPTPASESKRDRQVNIRLTADEKERLEESARIAGFRSVSDYIRHAALKSA